MGVIREENWGFGNPVPDMMPTRLLAALRYASRMQPEIRTRQVSHCAYGPSAKGSKLNDPHIRCDGSIFYVRIFIG